jgi:hypothetical protein
LFNAAQAMNDGDVMCLFQTKKGFEFGLLQWACRYDNIDIVRYCVESLNVDVGGNQNYPIREAVNFNSLKTVKYLLQHKNCNPGAATNSCIYFAAQNGFYDLVKLLLSDNRVDPSDDNNVAFDHSLLSGRKEIAWLLVQDKRVLQKVSKREMLNAAGRGFQDIVEFILNEKRDII